MLRSEKLYFSYEDHTLFSGLDLTLTPGITTILGPNGSGKSTLLKLFAGLLKPIAGDVFLNGQPLKKLSGRERIKQIAVVPQFPPPALDFTVEELVLTGRLAGKGFFAPVTRDDERKVREILAQLELEKYAEKPCSSLSGGELQRAAAAQALIRETPILLLDEPTASLDPAHAIRLLELLRSLPGERCILIISHDIFLAGKFSDRVLLLSDGRIAADGTPAEVLRPERLAEIYGAPAEYFSFFAEK